VRYADRDPATVNIEDAVPSSAVASGGATSGSATSPAGSASPGGPVSPIQRQQGTPSQRQINPNNPLAYFDILLESRDRARGIVSASNLRQIGLTLLTYYEAQGRWPETLEELQDHVPGFAGLLTNPRTGEDPGFIYEKPADGAEPSVTPVVWEAWQGQKDPNGAVLYADGSIR
jgi:hypothetical protein